MHMESAILTRCQHVKPLCTPQGLQRLSRAAESVYSPANRPIIGIGAESVPRCLYPECLYPAACNIHVCVQCVYMACLSHCGESESTSAQDSQDSPGETGSKVQGGITHVGAHYESSGHSIYLSAEYGHLFCHICDDFVFDSFLDAAIANQSEIAQAYRRNFISSVSPLDPPMAGGMAGSTSMVRRRGKRRRPLTSKAWTPTNKELEVIKEDSFPLPASSAHVLPPVGLYNLGNSCYMNSVLQAFLNAPPLRRFFLANEHKPGCTKDPKLDCFACAIDQLVCDSCFANETMKKKLTPSALDIPFLVPQTVLDIVWRNAEHLATYTQHDAHEFLIAALNLLSNHCRRESPVEVKREQKREPFIAEVNIAEFASAERTPSQPDAHRKMNPVSPVGNLRGDREGAFLGTALMSHPSRTSIVQNLFSGTLQSDVVCRVCGNSSPTLEKFYDVSLDVDKVIKPTSKRRSRAQSPVVDMVHDQSTAGAPLKRSWVTGAGGDRSREKSVDDARTVMADVPSILDVARNNLDDANGNPDGTKENDTANSLQECLSRFTEPELLGSSAKMHCANCATRQEAMKQMSIRTLPPIVCFHFKRFEQSFASVRRSEMVKINTAVEFPSDGLDLAPFLTSEVLKQRVRAKRSLEATTAESALLAEVKERLKPVPKPSPEVTRTIMRERQDSVYDLFAVVNHIGKIDSGHYTAMVRRGGVWFKCDDEKVTVMDKLSPVIRSEEAYLVFYAQRHPNIQYSQ